MVGDHPILFRGLTFDKGSGRPMPATDNRPVLVERTDEDFVQAFLEELSSDAGRKLLAGKVHKGSRLHQPVHHAFYLAVFEAACDTFGEPRLAPSRIESSGLVVRRLGADSGRREGWMKLGGEVRGWVPLADARESDRDPDPARRGAAFPAGHPELDTLLENTLGAPEPYEESVSLLFVAPPHVCAAARRTILYGLVPVSSSEAVSGKAAQASRYEEDELRDMLAPYFSANTGVSLEGLASKSYSIKYADELRADPQLSGQARQQAEQRLEQFITMLRKLVSVFNAFEHPELLAELNKVQFEYDRAPQKRPLGNVLKEAAEVFVQEQPGRTFLMPRSWPRLSVSDVSAIVRAASRASTTRLESLLPRRRRFDPSSDRYEVRGFIRVRRDDGCPPALVWSAPSQPFEIAAWYENAKRPPVQIALPPVTRDNVKRLLPNVAFQVPGNIFNLLANNKPKDFLEQKASSGGGGLDWICGFNIPIITLCAFIVLSIFLALLNIVFWWLPFIKICIPLPRRSGSRPPSIP